MPGRHVQHGGSRHHERLLTMRRVARLVLSRGHDDVGGHRVPRSLLLRGRHGFISLLHHRRALVSPVKSFGDHARLRRRSLWHLYGRVDCD
jgi:hypothetical protein